MAVNLNPPILFEMTPGSGSVTLTTFFLPDGSPFTDVLYSTNGGAFLSLGATSGPVTITEESDGTTLLVNDTSYSIRLVGVSAGYPLASNSLKSSPQIFTPVAAAGAPVPPKILAFTQQSGSVGISYVLGDNGGSAVTGVYYNTETPATWVLLPGPIDGYSLITELSNGNPLINGIPFTIEFVSVNAIEPLPEDNVPTTTYVTSSEGTSVPATSPQIITSSPLNASITVGYTLSADGGSSFVTVYYSTDNGLTWANTGGITYSALILTKSDGTGSLVNGTTYQVRLLVTTDDYPTPDPTINLPSNREDVTPASGSVAPDAPSLGIYTPGDKTLTVPYVLGSDGGSSVTAVFYSTDNGATWFNTGSVNGNAIITALSTDGTTLLTNETDYLVRLVALTADFPTTSNPPSAPPVNMRPSTSILRPSVVSIDGVAAGDASLEITYSIESTGGSPITEIRYSTDGGWSWKSSGTTNGYFVITTQSDAPFTLENGRTYFLLLVAATAEYPDYLNNPIPNSATPATPIAPDAPFLPPDAPFIDEAGVGDKTITVGYRLGSDGGSPITDVLYTTDGGDNWYSTGEKFPFGLATITALSTNGSTLLTNGTYYYVRLLAVTLEFSTTSNPKSVLYRLWPSATSVAPDAPLIQTRYEGDGVFQISYNLGSDGGSPVTDIQYSTNAGSDWLTLGNTSGTALITTDSPGNPLVNGTGYPIIFVTISVDFTDPNNNPQTTSITLTPTAATTVPPEPPIIQGYNRGNAELEVFFVIGTIGSGVLLGVYYSTDGTNWIDSGVVSGSFTINTDSGGNALVNDREYNVRIVAVTSDYPTPGLNIPSLPVPMTPFSGSPVAPDAPTITSSSPGNQSITVEYVLGSAGGSYYTDLWYSTNNGTNWQILDVGTSIGTSTTGIITTLSTDGTTPLTNGVTYTVRLMATTDAFPTPTNTPSEPVYRTPSATSLRPSAPVIGSWFGLDGTLVVRYTIPSNGGSPVTAVYYSTDSGLSWEQALGVNGTAVITITSGGSGPIVNSTVYGVRLLAFTVDFPSLSNPFSPIVLMVARPTIAGTFKPKGMSYTEFLRSKKADRVKILNTKPVRTASEITNARRLAASTVFALNNEAVKGSITTPIDFSQGGLHAARSYFKQGGASRRVGSASEFTAFSGSQAIGGLAQAGLPPTRLLQLSNFILVSAPVTQSAGDYLRQNQGLRVSLGQQHDLATVTPPVFVDNTIRNTGSPATVNRPAIHDIKVKNAFAYVPNRPSQGGGQYALKGDLEPGKELGAVGGNPHYKAGAALDNIPYVEKHHGNDLGVNPKRPFVKYQIPKGTPPHLKINKPINTI